MGGVSDTADSTTQTLYINSAVGGVNDTADQGTSKFSVLWLPLKEITIKKSYIGKLYYITYIYNIHTKI
jgi:hypothetical protein